MKRLKVGRMIVGACLILPVGALLGQSAQPAPSALQSVPALGTNYGVVASDSHSSVWERALPVATNLQGQVSYRTNRYIEIASGLNHLVNGEYIPSTDEIAITPSGGASTNCQKTVQFASDINSADAVQITTSDGRSIGIHILGISYYDPVSGSNVLVGITQSASGWLVRSNTVLYSNAFSGGIQASVAYENDRATIEQDVRLESVPPSPGAYGLPTNVLVQIWSEFDGSSPVVATNARGTDITLRFGNLWFGPGGRAFLAGGSSNPAAVTKQWVVAPGGRTFLVEQLQYGSVAAQMQNFPANGGGTNAGGGLGAMGPASAASGIASDDQGKNRILGLRASYPNFPKDLPPRPSAAKKDRHGLIMATASPPVGKGFVADWVGLDSDVSDYTFQSGTTYYVPGPVGLAGTTTIQNAAVIKIEDGAEEYYWWDDSYWYFLPNGLILEGLPLICPTGPYQMAFLTSGEDNSVGEPINDEPFMGSEDCYLSGGDYSDLLEVSNLRFSYANVGLFASEPLDIWNCQFVQCNMGIAGGNTLYGDFVGYSSSVEIDLHNVLFSGCFSSYSDGVAGNTVTFEQVTSDSSFLETNAYYSPEATFWVTNSILGNNCTGPCYIDGDVDNVWNPSSSIFTNVGAGNYYLADNTYRGTGTTGVSSQMLAELPLTTTWAPLTLTNTTITSGEALGAIVPRNTGAPDPGYHYWPIDYISSCAISGALLELTNSVVLGYYDTAINLQGGSQLISQGVPGRPDRIIHYTYVQEQPDVYTNTLDSTQPLNLYHTSGADPSLYFRFTTITAPENDLGTTLYADGGNYKFSSCTIRDSEIYAMGGTMVFGVDPSSALPQSAPLNLQNNLFSELTVSGYSSGNVNVQNNLFESGVVSFDQDYGAQHFAASYNAFDGGSFYFNGALTDNAFLNGATDYNSLQAGDIVTNLTWQTGPVGNYYQATNSPLINAGNVTADTLGLYHYTTQTNQMLETNSLIDIGYHYVALGTNGQPFDSSGNGPDYLLDANGNGVVDYGEQSWLPIPNYGFHVFITKPAANSLIP